MAQIKKTEVREAILSASFDLFSRKGFSGTTMTEIARAANMTVANVYVYFDSKLELFYALYHPWLLEQLTQLAASVDKLRSPSSRLRRILIGVWYDIPARDHVFSVSMIQALAVVSPGSHRPTDLFTQAEQMLGEMIRTCLPQDRQDALDSKLVSYIIWMAFDGFVVNRLFGDTRDAEHLVDMMVRLLLGEVDVAVTEE